MQISNKIVHTLQDISKNIAMEIILLNEIGEILFDGKRASKGAFDDQWSRAVFLDGVARIPKQKRTYFLLDLDQPKPWYFYLPTVSDDADRLGYLVRVVLRSTIKTMLSTRMSEQEALLRALVLDEMEPLELQAAIHDCQINLSAQGCVLLMQTKESNVTKIYDVMCKLFDEEKRHSVFLVSHHLLALVIQLDEEEDMDTIAQLVFALLETIENEVASDVVIGVGNLCKGLLRLHDSFEEALEALRFGISRAGVERTFFFHRLLLERFFRDIPFETKKRFHDLSYTDDVRRMMNDEMRISVNQLFTDNLNLSEAARNLFVHRNTLIYRLDKIQKTTGLDLRHFEDAVLMKFIMIVNESIEWHSGKNTD